MCPFKKNRQTYGILLIHSHERDGIKIEKAAELARQVFAWKLEGIEPDDYLKLTMKIEKYVPRKRSWRPWGRKEKPRDPASSLTLIAGGLERNASS